MNNIWFTSDLHFGHDREFIWGPRNFKSVYEMNEELIKRYNTCVKPNDDVYILGDLTLGPLEPGIALIKQLKGNIHVIRGNHDTNARMAEYNKCYNIVEITEGQYFKYGKYHFYLNHYPTITSNLEKSDRLEEHLINLYGHTHQTDKFYNGIPFMYNVGVDAHNGCPIHIDTIIMDIKAEVEKCKKYL